MAKNLRISWMKAKRQLEIAIPARQCIGTEGHLTESIQEDLMEIEDGDNKRSILTVDREAEKVAEKEKEKLRIKKEREEEIEQKKIKEKESRIKEEKVIRGELQEAETSDLKNEKGERNQKKREREKEEEDFKIEGAKNQMKDLKRNLATAMSTSSAQALHPLQSEINPTVEAVSRIQPASLSLELDDSMDDKKALKTALEASWQYLTEIDTFNAFAAPVSMSSK